MILMTELLKGKSIDDQSEEIKGNLINLLVIINKIRTLWGKPMKVTSGLRSMEEHLAIYASKKITDKSKIPMKSKHLYGQAVDIYDPNLEITNWLKANPKIMEDCAIFCESGNSNWVHIQITPFNSYVRGGSRWFNP
jgi:uncharacterized protein YcbK (DUF882 family)